MSAEVSQGRRVALIDGAARFDLVVPQRARVDDVLRAAGAATGGSVRIVGVAGREIDRLTPMSALDDGVVLILVDPDASVEVPLARVARSSTAPRATAAWSVMTAGGVVLTVVRLLGDGALPAGLRFVVGAVALLGALLAAVLFAVRARRGSATLAPVLAVGTLSFAGGVALVPQQPASTASVAVFTGLLCAAVVAGVVGVLGGTDTLRAQSRTATIIAALLASVWGVSLLLHLDVSAPAAVTLGLVPVAQRVLQSSLVDVAPGTFIDYGRFQSTRWTVRQSLPEEVRTIEADDADALVERSTARLTIGVVMLVGAGAAGSFAALPTFDVGDPVVLAGRIAVACSVVLALLLSSRKSTVPFLRWVARIGAGVIVSAVLAAVVPAMSSALLVAMAGALLVVGLGAALLVVPVGRGLRSLGWSRTGDVFEALATAFSLPAGMLAAGAVEIARAMMAT